MIHDTTLSDTQPSATPSEAEIAAWQALPRDEQLRRLRQALADPDCDRPSGATMEDIWAEIAARRGERT